MPEMELKTSGQDDLHKHNVRCTTLRDMQASCHSGWIDTNSANHALSCATSVALAGLPGLKQQAARHETSLFYLCLELIKGGFTPNYKLALATRVCYLYAWSQVPTFSTSFCFLAPTVALIKELATLCVCISKHEYPRQISCPFSLLRILLVPAHASDKHLFLNLHSQSLGSAVLCPMRLMNTIWAPLCESGARPTSFTKAINS